MITRRIGKLLRGKATPAQLMMACILGAMLGFMPGFAQAAGSIIVLTFLLLILNANLFLAGIVGLLSKALALLLMPVTFTIGRMLLDGPLAGLFRWLINAPGTALLGLEYYTTTGGLLLGLIVGIIVGLFAIKALAAFRMKMSTLEKDSERFKSWNSKGWVKLLKFIFIGGGHGKRTYEDLLKRKIGNPIRIVGVIAVVFFCVLIGIVFTLLRGPLVTNALRAGLERANGATVDVEHAAIDLREGRLTITGFAMADPNDLTTDLLRAARIEASISGADLFTKRLALDRVTLIEGASGQQRAFPGRIIGRAPTPSEPDPTITQPDEKTLEDYLRTAEQWKQRLAQVRRWLEKISGPEDATETEPAARRETLEQRLRRQIRAHGYAWVRADHHITDAPTFIIYQLDAERMRTTYFEDATVDLRARNISTHPHLNREAPSILIETSDDRFRAALALDHALGNGGASTLQFHLRGVETDRIAGQFAIAGTQPLQGGTIDLAADGTYGGEQRSWINLPLQTTLHNVTMSLGGTSQRINEITIPIGVRGPLDQPRITLDDNKLADALVRAGANELAGRVQSRIEDELGDTLDNITDRISDVLPPSLRDGLPLPGRNR